MEDDLDNGVSQSEKSIAVMWKQLPESYINRSKDRISNQFSLDEIGLGKGDDF